MRGRGYSGPTAYCSQSSVDNHSIRNNLKIRKGSSLKNIDWLYLLPSNQSRLLIHMSFKFPSQGYNGVILPQLLSQAIPQVTTAQSIHHVSRLSDDPILISRKGLSTEHCPKGRGLSDSGAMDVYAVSIF
jgi:hypothetical protein